MADPDDRRRLTVQVHYAQALLNESRGREAGKALEGVPERIARVLGPNHSLWFDAQRLSAGTLLNRGEHEQAVAMYRQLLERAARAGLEESSALVLMNSYLHALNMAMYNAQGEARRVLRDETETTALELARRCSAHFGPEAPLTLGTLVTAAEMTCERGDFQSAAEMCQKVLAAAPSRLGECHQVRTKAQDVLAEAMMHQGDPAAAADLRLKILQCERPRLDPVALVARISDSLPYLDRGGRWVEGEQLAREYSSTLQSLGGGHGAMQFSAELYIARFISLQGRLDDAEGLFAALRSREHEAADESPTVARLHMFYGGHLVRRGEYDQAEQHLQRAAQLIDIHHGSIDSNPDDLAAEFVALYQAWGKPDKMQEYQEVGRQALMAGMTAQ